MPPGRVRVHARIKRLEGLPAAVRGQRCAEVGTHGQAPEPPALPPPRGVPVRAAFSLLAMVAGSTLEALRQKTPGVRERQGLVLGGKRMVRGEAFRPRPLWPLSPDAATAHDKRCAAEIMTARPIRGLWVCAWGFCSLRWLDDVTDQQQFFVTRMRAKIASRPVQVRGQGPSDRDELIQGGPYHSNPCPPPRRLVSVLGPGVGYRSLTHVLDPQVLSARQVCERYRRRWRIADAFAVTTRVLDFASWWTGAAKAVQWQS